MAKIISLAFSSFLIVLFINLNTVNAVVGPYCESNEVYVESVNQCLIPNNNEYPCTVLSECADSDANRAACNINCKCVEPYKWNFYANGCRLPNLNEPGTCSKDIDCMDSRYAIGTCYNSNGMCACTNGVPWNSLINAMCGSPNKHTSCTAPSQCFDTVNGDCMSGFCDCKSSYIWSTRVNKCVSENNSGGTCKSVFDCYDSSLRASCNGVCGCKPNCEYVATSKKCVCPNTGTFACDSIDACKDSSTNGLCSKTCQCITNTKWDSNRAQCLGYNNDASSCTSNYDCADYSTYGQCLSSRCVCTNSRQWSSVYLQCLLPNDNSGYCGELIQCMDQNSNRASCSTNMCICLTGYKWVRSLEKCVPLNSGTQGCDTVTDCYDKSDKAECLPSLVNPVIKECRCRPGFIWNTTLLECYCSEGNYININTNECKKCKPGEFQANGNQIFCQQCLPGTYSEFEGETICPSCPNGLVAIGMGNSKCTECPLGSYYIPGNSISCGQCDSNCLTCNILASNCTSCASDKILTSQSKCVCGSHTYTELDSLNEPHCWPCHNLADTCFGPLSNQSLTCNPNIPNLVLVETTCKCRKGYFLKGEACERCDRYCEECEGVNTNCSECIRSPGIISVEINNKCLCNTTDSYYEIPENITLNITKKCLPCHPLSKRCYGPNFWESLECNELAFLPKLQENSTECQCMDGYYYQPKFVNSEYMNLCQPCKRECITCNGTSSNCKKFVEYPPSKPISTGSQAITSSTSGVMLVSTIATGTSLTSIVSVGDIVQYSILCEDIKLAYRAPEIESSFKGLKIMQFDFMPNFMTYFNPFSKNTTKSLRLLQGEDNSDLEKRTFLLQTGSIISLFLIILIIYPIIVLVSLYVDFFNKIRGFFEWSGFFAIIMLCTYPVLRAACLQLSGFSHSKGIFYTISCYSAILAILFYGVFFIIVIKILTQDNKELQKEETKKKYGCLYESHYLSEGGKYTTAIELLRKFIVISLMTVFRDSALKVCIVMLGGSSMILFWHILILPKRSHFGKIASIAGEICSMFTVFGFMSLSELMPQEDVARRIQIVFYIFIGSPILVSSTYLIEQIYNVIMKIKSCFENDEKSAKVANLSQSGVDLISHNHQ